MKPEELRIGNWVHHEIRWSYRQLGAIHSFDFQWDDEDWHALGERTIDLNEISPIPLTEEWLKKFGFKDPPKNGMAYRMNINSSDELCWYRQDDSLRYQTQGSGFTRNFGIKYVHQLQNLYYALTGNELTIKKDEA
jgi:hypothetical protein